MVGAVLVRCWCGAGAVLVRCWCGAGADGDHHAQFIVQVRDRSAWRHYGLYIDRGVQAIAMGGRAGQFRRGEGAFFSRNDTITGLFGKNEIWRFFLPACNAPKISHNTMIQVKFLQ